MDPRVEIAIVNVQGGYLTACTIITSETKEHRNILSVTSYQVEVQKYVEPIKCNKLVRNHDKFRSSFRLYWECESNMTLLPDSQLAMRVSTVAQFIGEMYCKCNSGLKMDFLFCQQSACKCSHELDLMFFFFFLNGHMGHFWRHLQATFCLHLRTE